MDESGASRSCSSVHQHTGDAKTIRTRLRESLDRISCGLGSTLEDVQVPELNGDTTCNPYCFVLPRVGDVLEELRNHRYPNISLYDPRTPHRDTTLFMIPVRDLEDIIGCHKTADHACDTHDDATALHACGRGNSGGLLTKAARGTPVDT